MYILSIGAEEHSRPRVQPGAGHGHFDNSNSFGHHLLYH